MNESSIHWDDVPHCTAEPDFNNLLAVLGRTTPPRPTLFEFFLNGPLYERLAGDLPDCPEDVLPAMTTIMGFRNAGYDYVTRPIPNFGFPAGEAQQESTRSLNAGVVIRDEKSFDAYEWQDPADADYGILDRLQPYLPDGMKFIVNGPGGVLENVIRLVGYENLCYMTCDNMPLVSRVFEAVGSRLVEYYRGAVGHDTVGALIGNDDWGFKSQTMLPPDQMRELVFPWHKQIVTVAHGVGKPAILHSCGDLSSVMDDVIDDMKYDGKHSYEDTIQPVEAAHAQYGDRIAILGGIDVDFVCRSTPQAVYDRSLSMIESRAAYALGTGNSVPEYVPDKNYFAMIRAALSSREG